VYLASLALGAKVMPEFAYRNSCRYKAWENTTPDIRQQVMKYKVLSEMTLEELMGKKLDHENREHSAKETAHREVKTHLEVQQYLQAMTYLRMQQLVRKKQATTMARARAQKSQATMQKSWRCLQKVTRRCRCSSLPSQKHSK
jgi:hypothetical protein